METNMSNGIGEYWITFAYPSLLTDSICRWSFELLHGGLIVSGPTQANHKARPYTQLVCMDHGP